MLLSADCSNPTECSPMSCSSLQEERGVSDPSRAHARPQEAAFGFHRPAAPYATGYF